MSRAARAGASRASTAAVCLQEVGDALPLGNVKAQVLEEWHDLLHRPAEQDVACTASMSPSWHCAPLIVPSRMQSDTLCAASASVRLHSQAGVTFGQQHDVVKEIEDLGRRLQQGYEHGGMRQVCKIPQVPHDLIGRGRVQACADLVLLRNAHVTWHAYTDVQCQQAAAQHAHHEQGALGPAAGAARSVSACKACWSTLEQDGLEYLIISAVVTRFFWPPLMPLIMELPTYSKPLQVSGACPPQAATAPQRHPKPCSIACNQALHREQPQR